MTENFAGHTPGPWRWEINWTSKSIELAGGKPTFDKTVMDFARWGLSGATPRFNEAAAGGEYNIMERPADFRSWTAPFPGREHHENWCANLTHPDAALIAAAPTLLAERDALRAALETVECERDEALSDLAETDREGDALRARVAELEQELRAIATAQPAQWDEDMRDQFQAWAQNRARHALRV